MGSLLSISNRQHGVEAAGVQGGCHAGGEPVSLLCAAGAQAGAALGQLLGACSSGAGPHLSVERRQPPPVPAQSSELSPPELDAYHNPAHGEHLRTCCGVLLVLPHSR